MSVVAHSQSLRVITTLATAERLVIDIQEGAVIATLDAVESLLSELNPRWLPQLHGARDRAVRRGPDWPRHWASSYRTLFKNVVHRVAPSNVVKQWPAVEFDDKGNPTRRSKVRWLCRNEPADLRAWRVADIESVLAFLGVMDAANHEDEADIIESDVSWLSLRVERALKDILELALRR
jgi:hypothetical protein